MILQLFAATQRWAPRNFESFRAKNSKSVRLLAIVILKAIKQKALNFDNDLITIPQQTH